MPRKKVAKQEITATTEPQIDTDERGCGETNGPKERVFRALVDGVDPAIGARDLRMMCLDMVRHITVNLTEEEALRPRIVLMGGAAWKAWTGKPEVLRQMENTGEILSVSRITRKIEVMRCDAMDGNILVG